MDYYLSALQDYASFNGRASRSEYWYFLLFNLIIAFLFTIIGIAAEMPLISPLYTAAVLLPAVGVSIRRMHDVGKSGWYILIPIYNLILACTEGEKGANQYGPDPKNDFSEINNIGEVEA